MECQEHKGETTLVCVTCDNKLLCPQCFDDHTKGHDIQSLMKVVSRTKQALNYLSASFSDDLFDIRLIIRHTQDLQKEQDVLERQAINKINIQREMLHEAIDKFAENLVKICKQRKQKNLTALQEREKLLSSQKTDITKLQSKIHKLLQSKNYAEVIKTSETVKPVIVEHIPRRLLESLDIHISQINRKIIDIMLGQIATTPADDDVSDCFDSLDLQTAVSRSKYQKEGSGFVGSVGSEGGLTRVSDIVSNTSDFATVIRPSVPGHAWVRWSDQKEIQLIDAQSSVKQSIKFEKLIHGITTTQDNRLLVCGRDNKYVYQVVHGSAPSVYFSTALYPYDICTTDSADLLVSMVGSSDPTTRCDNKSIVSKYSCKGHHLSDSAVCDSFGDRLFVRPLRLTVNNTNTVVAVANRTSDSPPSSHLVLLDTSLNLKLRYDGNVTPANKQYKPKIRKKFLIEDVTFTPECNILVTEQHSQSILLLDSDCQLLKTLWRDDQLPVSLCLHNDGKLWCGFYKKNGGVIKVFKQ